VKFIYDDSSIFKEGFNNFNIRLLHIDDYIFNFISVFNFFKVATKNMKLSIFDNVNNFMIDRINNNAMIIRVIGITFEFIDGNNLRKVIRSRIANGIKNTFYGVGRYIGLRSNKGHIVHIRKFVNYVSSKPISNPMIFREEI